MTKPTMHDCEDCRLSPCEAHEKEFIAWEGIDPEGCKFAAVHIQGGILQELKLYQTEAEADAQAKVWADEAGMKPGEVEVYEPGRYGDDEADIYTYHADNCACQKRSASE